MEPVNSLRCEFASLSLKPMSSNRPTGMLAAEHRKELIQINA
jgi:hypothetical protein